MTALVLILPATIAIIAAAYLVGVHLGDRLDTYLETKGWNR